MVGDNIAIGGNDKAGAGGFVLITACSFLIVAAYVADVHNGRGYGMIYITDRFGVRIEELRIGMNKV